MMPMAIPRPARGPDPTVAPLAQDLLRDQERIRALAEMLATGIEPAHTILGLIRVESRPLSADGGVETLFELLRRYEDARARLVAQRGLWSECLAHLGPRLTAAFAPRAEKLRQLERKRLSLEETARGRSDAELVERTGALRERLEASLSTLAAVVVALVRRGDTVRAVLAEWDRQAQQQATLLGQMRERAEARARVLELEREVREFEHGREGASPGEGPAGPFDELFQPLDRGLDTAREADDRLQVLVRDLLGLALDLEEDVGAERLDATERQAGDALLRGPLDDAALLALAFSDSSPSAAAGTVEPLEHRLRKVETTLDRGCLAAFGEEAFLRRAQRAADPYLWRDYLTRYPQAAAAAEARTAIEVLDRMALARAEREASRLAWWSYLRDFPDGSGAAKAREALEKMPTAPGPAEVLKRLATPTEGSVFLGELSPLECQVGWGALRVNEGGEVRVLGERCECFLLPHPPARVVYGIPEGFVRFSAIGTRLDAREAAHGTWRYEVRFDDRTVFQSPPLHDQPDGIPIELPLPAGSKRLEIRIDDYGDGHYDWAALAWPMFHRT